MILLATFLALLFAYSLVSARVARTVLTAPMVFTAAGLVAYPLLRVVPRGEAGQEFFLRMAETGLVLLLFTDASRTDLDLLRRIRALPTRLLSAGMLLTLLLGGLAAAVVFGRLTIWEAGILSAILAPTDAGLGQIIVSSPRVPRKIREALNVEAGLNDGLSVPFLLFFIALAGSGTLGQDARLGGYIVEQLGYGAVVGGGIGLLGGWLLRLAKRHEWVAASFLQLAVVSLPLLCLVASEAVAASMFIAAFVAGLTVQIGFREAGKHSVEFTEDWGQVLNLAVFFLFGLLCSRAWPEFRLSHLVYAVISLTVVRMAPVALALVGTRLSAPTVLFMGWFGPRGLASIVLGVVFLEHAPHCPGGETIRLAVMVTVLLSIFAHGLTARPGIELYARRLATLPPGAPETAEASTAPFPT